MLRYLLFFLFLVFLSCSEKINSDQLIVVDYSQKIEPIFEELKEHRMNHLIWLTNSIVSTSDSLMLELEINKSKEIENYLFLELNEINNLFFSDIESNKEIISTNIYSTNFDYSEFLKETISTLQEVTGFSFKNFFLEIFIDTVFGAMLILISGLLLKSMSDYLNLSLFFRTIWSSTLFLIFSFVLGFLFSPAEKLSIVPGSVEKKSMKIIEQNISILNEELYEVFKKNITTLSND